MQKASASTSRTVVVGNVSEPVSSWIPRANTVASSGVTSSPRSATMRSISVTSEPSWEVITLAGSTNAGRPPAGRWWSNTTISTPGCSVKGPSSPSRLAWTVSTSTRRVTPARSTTPASITGISSANSVRNSRTLRLTAPLSTMSASG